MERIIEKKILLIAGIWDILIGIVTIFGYAVWFKNKGIAIFENHEKLSYLNTSILDNLVSVIMIYGLIIFVIGLGNIYLSRRLNKILNHKLINIWLLSCLLIHFLSFDIVGIILYLLTLVIYIARLKALKMVNNTV